jgi:hypothetical protein
VTIASFLDLCLDARTGNALALARFWHRVLGGTFVDHGDGSARLDLAGGTRLYVDPVPEARTGGTRVHLDLRLPATDPQPLVAAGATLLREPGGDIEWWVLTDPEGNEFCAFPPRPGTPRPAGDALAHVYELVVGAADADAQAAWWASVLGGTARTGDGGASVEGAARFPWEYLVFDPLPWPKAVKNRMHWDVDLTDPTPDALVAAGARVLREPGEVHWWVMADPEGNEFCAFPPKD